MNFLVRLNPTIRRAIKNIEIDTYKKTTGMAAFSAMLDCRNLEELRIHSNINTNATPSKAAKALFVDAGHFLKTLGVLHGDPEHGVKIMRFGETIKCFAIKNGDELRAWTAQEVERFHQVLLNLAR